MQTIRRSFLICLFYLPLVFTLINGHQFVHSDETDSSDEVCLVCHFQQEQDEQVFLLPEAITVSIPFTNTWFTSHQFYTTKRKQVVGYSQATPCRPPPAV